MKTTQAVRNIRKFKRKIETAPKGRMVTDDYGNKLSVKKKADGTFGRRHTLSQGKKRAIRLGADNLDKYLERHKRNIEYGTNEHTRDRRHSTSAVRRNREELHAEIKNPTYAHKQKIKSDYHSARRDNSIPASNILARSLHKGTKRKPKDFTK